MKRTKKALFSSIMALILCFSMLVGTTFAWFTDEVSSGKNQIVAGNLDIELYWTATPGDPDSWKRVDEKTNIFKENTLWEPGHTEVVYLKIVNEGTLALKYQLGINVAGETGSVNVLGEDFKLSQYIRYGVEAGQKQFANRDAAVEAVDATATVLNQAYASNVAKLESKGEQVVTLVVYMPTSVGNEANHAKDRAVPTINLGIRLMATQMEAEMDSFGDDYDKDSTWPPATIHFSETVDVPAVGALAESVTIGQTSYIHAILPAGFVAGNTTLELKIDSMERQANVTLEPGATAQSYNVHIEGVDATNGQAAIITVPGMLPSGLSELKVELYHVENGVAAKMTRVDAAEQVKNHNEFHYDSATGGVIMALASFSEVMVVVNPVKEGEILINETVTTEVDKETVDQNTGELKQSMTIAVAPATGDNTTGDETTAPAETVSAVVPEGVKLAEDATSLTLDVTTIPVEESQANIVLEEGEIANAIDVHIEGVAEDNTVPMIITLPGVLPKGLNRNNIRLYHVENGNTVEMTYVSFGELDAHNEFHYNAATGDVVLLMASFSEVVTLTNDGHWNGVSDIEFAGGDGSAEKPYLIASAGQLAYFRDIVDGKVEWKNVDGTEKDRTFAGQYVKLANNIFLNHEGEFKNLFDPIGWGYSYAAYNRDGAEGKVFKGTFDGDRYAIHGLWQDGWQLGYSYTNCGGGLFASVENATIKNLVMIDAIVTFECVEIGIVAGLAQGNCNFESIFIYDSKIANYQRATGGVVGEISPSRNADGTAISCTFNFNKVMLDTSVVVGSLWGDFDTPVGGIIGARWDDDNVSKVLMDTCDIACELDVYNDVTSTYQWYAYRRAGMLIGNTDTPPADGKNSKVATAEFLTCNDVDVYYTNWAKYNYCQFSNHNSSWPWVRVQAGENCEAYSNPRYGVPNDVNGNKVTGYDHVHKEGDQCNIQIFFNQLYGGGQGVYGQPEHPNVNTDVKYLVTFMHDDHVAGIQFVEESDIGANGYQVQFPKFEDLPHFDNTKTYTWIDAQGQEMDTDNTVISENNRRDIFYYINRTDKYYVHFVDKDGFYVAELEFNPKTGKFVDTNAVVPEVPEVPGYYGTWEEYKMQDATADIIVNAVYSKATIDVVMDDADALFRLLEEGKHVAMSKDLTGGFGSANKRIFCDIPTGKDSRVDINSFTLSYDGVSSAGNKAWTLFQLQKGAKLTVGDGFAGFGVILFNLKNLGNGSTACVFNINPGGTLVIERGIEIELRYPNSGEVTFFQGVNIEKYPGLTVKQSTNEENNTNGYSYIRIIATARTVLVGEDSNN